MARFRFGKKKKESDPDSSMTTSETVDDSPNYHLYLRRPSISSRQQVETPPHQLADDLVPHEDTPGADLTATTPWKRFKLYDSPFPRYRHAASLITSEKNEIFLMGGLKEGSVFGDTWKVVPEVDSNNAIKGFKAQHVEVINNNNPPARVGHSSVLCGNAYIIYGGDTVDTDYNGYPDDNFYMFNVNNCKYTIPLHILSKPRGRYGHLIGVVSLSATSSRLYLFGGQLENDVFNDLYYFELTSFKLPKARWELVDPLNNFKPPPLTNHSMSIHKNKIYVFGGVYNNEKVSNDVWCFDTLINKWLQLNTTGDVPLPVNEHSAVIVGDHLYVYGGNDFSGAIYDTLHSLDLHSLKWSKLSKDLSVDGPGARCGHSITYIPKLNQLVIMGGDKNDYIFSEQGNFATYEEFDGQELGTMIYTLDLPTVDHFLRGGLPKKVAASAGGAAGVLNRRAPSPLPSEEGLARHRRSFSAGLEDFRTPNASIERIARSLDPNRAPGDAPRNDEPVTPVEKFVDVDIPSSSAISEKDMTSDLEDVRDRYIAGDEAPSGSYHNGHSQLLNNGSPEDLRAENGTPILSRDFAHLSQPLADEDNTDDIAQEPPLSTSQPKAALSKSAAGGLAAGAAGAAALGASKLFGDRAGSGNREISAGNGATSRIASANSHSESDAKVKKIISELNSELTELKSSTKLQMQHATEKILALEQENLKLKLNNEQAAQEKLANLTKQVQEKDILIDELRQSVDPQELEIGEGDESGSIATSKRGFTELTKLKLNRLEMANKLVYLENENSQLKDKFARFEPFMNNQIGEISTLQKVIKGQEDRIQGLTAQVKLESVLHQQIAEWRHKFENLDLEFQNYKALYSEVDVSDDEEVSREVDGDASFTTSVGGRKSTRQISSQLENLVLLWKTTNAPDSDTRLLNAEDNPVVTKLQKQVDELLLTSKQQHEGSSAEVQTLEAELQAKLVSLRTFEDNYRDALQSVNNTSKALNLTQDELKNQKITIERLIKENNELKLYKKASVVSKRNSSAVSTPVLETSPGAPQTTGDHQDEDEEGITSAHYNMKLKDLEADLYILKQERDQLTDTVTGLKKELYMARNGTS